MNDQLLAQLERLKQYDLDTRERLLAAGRLYGTYDDEMQSVHRDNAQALDEIISIHGWPGIAKVGAAGAEAAWLIAQHAICTPELQRMFLARLAEAAGDGDAPMWQVALLTDRIRFNEGRPQVYGTVLDWDENGELSCEVENPDGLNERRQAVGLPDFEQSLQRQRRDVAAEGGGPPQNFQAYRRAQSEWAERTGWR